VLCVLYVFVYIGLLHVCVYVHECIYVYMRTQETSSAHTLSVACVSTHTYFITVSAHMIHMKIFVYISTHTYLITASAHIINTYVYTLCFTACVKSLSTYIYIYINAHLENSQHLHMFNYTCEISQHAHISTGH